MQAKKNAIFTAICAILALASLNSISACGKKSLDQMQNQGDTAQKACIKADFDIQVKDPLLKRITQATSDFKIKASGTFAKGEYRINGKSVRIGEDTKFAIDLDLPIDDPSSISTKDATGLLTTSHPFAIAGVTIPQKVELKKGTVTAEVDLMRSLGAFVVEMIEQPILASTKNDDVASLVQKLVIHSATMHLRPGAKLVVQDQCFHVGKNSQVMLTSLIVDENADYRGACLLDIDFLPGSHFAAPKVDCTFDGGTMKAMLNIRRKGQQLSLSTPRDQSIRLNDCTFKFGKYKQNLTRSRIVDIDLKSFDWAEGDETHKAYFAMEAVMALQNSDVEINGKTFNVKAHLPAKEPAELSIQVGDQIAETFFKTHDKAMADKAHVTIVRPSTNLQLHLSNVNLGTIQLLRTGDIDFKITQGKSNLDKVVWESAKNSFDLVCDQGSQLNIAKGMELGVIKENGQLKASYPLVINSRKATLKSQDDELVLTNLKGNLNVIVDQEISLDSNLDLSIPQLAELGNEAADIAVRGLQIANQKNQTQVFLKKCTILIKSHELSDVLAQDLPKSKSWELDQMILKNQTWRYRNGKLKEITVQNPTLDNIKFDTANQADFTATADVKISGEVEKGGIGAIFKKDTKWKPLPWSASATVSGTGTVSYKFEPRHSLNCSVLQYELSMHFKQPKDLDLDWSKVNTGILQKAERSIIIAEIKKSQISDEKKGQPLVIKDKIRLFDRADKKSLVKRMKIKQFATKPTLQGTQIDFVAEATL